MGQRTIFKTSFFQQKQQRRQLHYLGNRRSMFAAAAVVLTVAFSADVVDAACLSTCANPKMGLPENQYEVLVIGAGMAGISAARTMVEEAGFNSSRYIVVDAYDYIGGRMRKDTFGDDNTIIEWGANWIEGGSAQNEILNLASEYNVDYDRQAFTDWDTYLNAGSGNVNPVRNNQVQQQLNRARQAFGNCLGDVAEDYDVNGSGADDPGYKQALKDVCDWDPTGDALQLGVDWYSSSYAFPDAADKIGIYNTFYQDPYNAQFYLVVDQDDGIAGLATNVVQDLNLNVKLNTHVDCVDWESVPVKVYTSGDECIVYDADVVISTLSVGALTQDPGIFYPPLQSIKDMSRNPYNFGIYYKVMCQFPQKFWGDQEFIHIVGDERGYCGFWQNLDLPYFIPGSRILFCTLTTEVIEEIGSGDGEIPDMIIEEFVAPLFDAFDVDQNDRIYECDYYNWLQDPCTFGSYAYWKKGGTIPGFNEFFAPLTEFGSSKVIFGGAASCLDFGERLQGALLSGQDAANMALMELGEIGSFESVCVSS